MKKRRGLRRYYGKLAKVDFIENLSFEGEDSWFDYYHIHVDNTGLGNRSWKSRKQHLDALFSIAEQVESKLKDYSDSFQYWIEIHEDDSFDDAIYIHTKNPNESQFPAELIFDDNSRTKNQNLLEYLKSKDYKLETKFLLDDEDELVVAYFLQKDNLGLSINKNALQQLL